VVFTLRHSRHVGGRKQNISKLAPFVSPPAIVHCSIVICVPRGSLIKQTRRRRKREYHLKM